MGFLSSSKASGDDCWPNYFCENIKSKHKNDGFYFNRNIRMKRKCRHSLMNICLAMLFLVSFYAGGVNRVAPQRMCQIVGIGIHYFSICSLIWMAIATRNLLKALARRERTLPPGEVAPPRRPILGFYFIGWGKFYKLTKLFN